MQPRMCVMALLAAACIAASGCGLFQLTDPRDNRMRTQTFPVLANPGSAVFRVGAAKEDITPPPGYSTLGFGPSARFSRGFWTRLWARAVVLEDAQGHRVAMVSCDLGMVAGGLTDRVLEILQSDPGPAAKLGRHEVVIAATHTHHGPANFSSAYTYNFGGGRVAGFDPELFEFLARKIARSIAMAQLRATEARLSWRSEWLPGMVRNRSLATFRLNPEANEMLREGRRRGLYAMSSVGGLFTPASYLAVRPRLFVLDARALIDGRPGDVIARLAFFPAHPTALRSDTELYGADFFGVASEVAERSLRGGGVGHDQRSGDYVGPVVPIFNGAEGDVHVAWNVRDRRETLGFGRRLARAILREAELRNITDPDITWIGRRTSLKHKCLPPGRAGRPEGDPFERCTAARALPGVATVGGGVDGYTVLNEAGWKEGVKGDRRNDPEWQGQGVKHPSLDLNFDIGLRLPVRTSTFVKERDVPGEALLGVYQIGPIAFATLPAELTTTMGWRIEKQLSERLERRSRGVTDVVLIGLANEYISYITTPEEYEAQRYEAASTMYGPYSGPVLQYMLDRLAEGIGEAPPPPVDPTQPRNLEELEYWPGIPRRFTLAAAAHGRLAPPPGTPTGGSQQRHERGGACRCSGLDRRQGARSLTRELVTTTC